MRSSSIRAFAHVLIVVSLLAAAGVFAVASADSSVEFKRMTAGSPTLQSGFSDWKLCYSENRVESHPSYFWLTKWGCATIEGGSGCGCGGGASFSGNPETAGTGFAIAPPHDFSSNKGQLPPNGHDHPYVMASTGEVVYVETDFVIPGVGFDLNFTRTYRSSYDYSGEMGEGWDYSAQLFLVENAAATRVTAYLGNGRLGDKYEWENSAWTSPDGFYDQLTEDTRPGGHTYAGQNYYIKTEKNGVVWEFDLVNDALKDWYACTSIEDPFGNEMEFEYTDVSDPTLLTKITDTEGREVTFTRSSGRITQVTVSSSSIHADYGNVTIDYEYTSDRLTKVTKHKTRQSDGGTVVRPYTEYTYYTSGAKGNNVNLVKDCGTTIFDFDYTVYNTDEDRCTQVTDADAEDHDYVFDEGDVSDDWTEYTDPFGQQQDFVYEDLSGGDRTIKERRDWLEDENGDDILTSADTIYTRNCDCGQISEIKFSDGSKEKWTYDSYGNQTKYTRVSSDVNDDDLVQQWTYDTFANRSRMLTSSGWLRAESNPSSKVTWTWNTDGTLQKAAWPSVSTGQPSSQTIEFAYTWYTDGRLKQVTKPNGDEQEYTYSTDDITRADDPDTLDREFLTKRDLMGNVTATQNPMQTNSLRWDMTVAPDGRLLKTTGPDGQEVKYEYDLRGRRTKEDRLLDDTPTRVATLYTVSAGGVTTQTETDDGGIEAISTYEINETSRYTQSLDPEEYGTKTTIGYGSHDLPWKVYNVDDSGGSPVETLVKTIERDTMGRVTAEVLQGGTRVEYGYDGYGRKVTTTTDLPSSKERIVTLTLKDWGAVEKEEVDVGSTNYVTRTHYYDEAIREWKVLKEDPENVLADRITEFERDANGRVATRTDARDSEWDTEWDAVGRVTKTIDPIGNEQQYAYNDTNRTRTITSKEKDTSDSTFTEYDVVETRDRSGRLVSMKDEGSASGNRTTSYEYDEGGRRTKLTKPEGGEIAYEYDNLGRMTSEDVDIDATTTAETTFTYFDNGKRKKVTDANSVNTEWTYDSFGRELTVKYDDTASQTYTKTYDSYGRLDTETDPMGNERDYTYDIGGRMTQIDIDKDTSGLVGPDRLVYVYDDMNRVTSGKTQDYNGSTYDDVTSVTRSYDGFGQLESETQHGGWEFDYVYDDGGTLKEITYPSGGPLLGVRYDLDAMGRVDAVDRKLNTTVDGISTVEWVETATFEYEGHREIERLQDTYDLLRTQTWTSYKEPSVLTYDKDSTSALLTGFAYYWDKNRRITVRERMHDEGTYDWGEVYRYDEMDRLTSAYTDVKDPSNYQSSNPTGTNYDHADLYNLGKVYERESTEVMVNDVIGSPYAYTMGSDGLYQYASIDGATHTWDANGQLSDDGTWEFEWTGLGQLAQADDDTDTLDFTYDAFRRRVQTDLGSDESEFVYLGWHMVGEYDDANDVWLWQETPMNAGEGMLEHVALDSTDYDAYAVQEDWQNTVVALSDNYGAVFERYRYRDPFGDSFTEDSSQSNIGDLESGARHCKRLHGGVAVAQLGLMDFRYRWLQFSSSNWLSRDPLGNVDSANLYQAQLANPLAHRDPFGAAVSCPGEAQEWFEIRCDVNLLADALEDILGGFASVETGLPNPADLIEACLGEVEASVVSLAQCEGFCSIAFIFGVGPIGRDPCAASAPRLSRGFVQRPGDCGFVGMFRYVCRPFFAPVTIKCECPQRSSRK